MPIAITAAQVRAFLRELGRDAEDPTPLTGGLWSTVYAFREGPRELVVRFHERRDDLEKDRYASRWGCDRVRVPKLLEIGEGRYGAYGIAERVRGTPLDNHDAQGVRRALPALFDALDALRDADLSGSHGYGLWHGDGNAPFSTWRETLGDRHAIASGRERLAGTPVGTDGFDAGVGRIAELLPHVREDRHVVHNDLLYRNVLVDDRGVVLLDWGASVYGDFLYDWALLTFWWPYYRDRWGTIDIDRMVRTHLEARPTPSLAERMRACELDIGVSHILFQASRGDTTNALWTSHRTLELARAPLG